MAAENPLFTPEAKEAFLTNFETFDEKKKANLTQVLINAALHMQQFPKSMLEDIDPLQKAYDRNYKNEKIRAHQKASIELYFETEGTEKFLEATQSSADQKWSSSLLNFISRELELEIEAEPIIEAKIKKNGKIIWHTIHPISGEILEHQGHSTRRFKPGYNKAKCWRMTVADFRKFKDSGKRWGNQAITRERFVEYFSETHNKLQAGEVWDELKEIGVLNKNDRLSANWRALSNESIELDTVATPPHILSLSDIMEALKEIGGESKSVSARKAVTKKAFINYWNASYKEEAGKIWGILKKQRMLDEKNRPNYGWVKSCSNKIKNRLLTYSTICSALYEIANTAQEDEHFRPERSFNKWTEKAGIVQNNFQPKGQTDKPYDVGIFSELKAHEVSNDQTEHDHVTSAAILSAYKQKRITSLTTDIEDSKSAVDLLEKQLAFLEDEDDIQMYQQAIEEENVLINSAQTELNRIKNETAQNWWAIELPEDKHHRGLTYQLSSTKQIKKIKKPFLDEANHYLNETQSTDAYVEEVGAFRNLYRSQTRNHAPVNGHAPVGHIPFLFFQDRPRLSAQISGMFNARIQEHIEKTEGLTKPAAARKLEFK